MFVSNLYKRYFILHPFLYEYAYKLGASYKVCIKDYTMSFIDSDKRNSLWI